MQCTSPLSGYRAVEGGYTSSISRAYADKPLTIRCGKCMGCRLNRAYVWAVRCTHEASLYDNNIFATLTYDDEHLPYGETLVRKHMQDFMKRLRKRNPKVRVFYCGEYGGQTDRPHYHACLFNYAPSDPELMAVREAKKFYRSDKLDDLWKLGHVNYSDVTFQSAAYTAGYITKKIGGPIAEEHYQWIDESSGEILQRTPEFQGQSLRPGIGEPWIRNFLTDVYPRDLIVIDGKKQRPPRYYDQICERERPDLWKQTLQRRNKHKHTIIERYDGQQAVSNNKDPDEYFGSSRQMFAKNKIILSRQRERNEQ